jgi:type III pantothenate kinase
VRRKATRHVVVDIGNTRIKFAAVHRGRFEAGRLARLPADDPASWSEQLRLWRTPLVAGWEVASVHPERLAQLKEWIADRGEPVRVVNHFRQVPVKLNVEFPDRVGLDRLLNALAVTDFLPKGTPAVVIDVGTAVTIDWLDEWHVFQGGAILPGPRLMFESLHRETAKLPLVDSHAVPEVDLPGKNTRHAMDAGVMAAQLGAAEYLVREYARPAVNPPWVILTGGALGAMADFNFPDVGHCRTDPLLTLRGIRLAAMTIPSEGSP